MKGDDLDGRWSLGMGSIGSKAQGEGLGIGWNRS